MPTNKSQHGKSIVDSCFSLFYSPVSLLLMVLGGNHSGTSESGLSNPPKGSTRWGQSCFFLTARILLTKLHTCRSGFARAAHPSFPPQRHPGSQHNSWGNREAGGVRGRGKPQVWGEGRIQEIGQTLCSCRAESSPAQELSSQ